MKDLLLPILDTTPAASSGFQPRSRCSLWMPVTLALLLLPLGVWRLGARQSHGLTDIALAKCRTVLKPWQHSEAVRAGHSAPVASLHWLHVTVAGVVPSMAARASIHQEIDQLDGIRCDPGGIADLRVMPHLEARREENRIVLAGEVSLPETVSEAVRLMVKAEPKVSVDASAVAVHPAVLPVSLPQRVQDAAAHAFLGKAWQAVNFAWPGVTIDFGSPVPRLAGQFPHQSVRDKVVDALRAARPDLVLDDQEAVVDDNLPPVDFTGPQDPEWAPPGWLKDTWDQWSAYPALRLRLERNAYRLDGLVPSTPVLNTVLTVLHRLRPDLQFAKGDLKIRQGSLDKPILLPASLKGWEPPPWLQPLVEQLSALPPPSSSPATR